eukprot:4389156-Pleurochrysis_carterae.AAC.3
MHTSHACLFLVGDGICRLERPDEAFALVLLESNLHAASHFRRNEAHAQFTSCSCSTDPGRLTLVKTNLYLAAAIAVHTLVVVSKPQELTDGRLSAVWLGRQRLEGSTA